MPAYRVQLRETRMATDGTDDVAIFDVTREDDGQTWQVPVYLTPLFRLVRMETTATAEKREAMVAGLGARVITERLEQGQVSQLEEPAMMTLDYPGAPDDPEPLSSYEEFVVQVDEETG